MSMKVRFNWIQFLKALGTLVVSAIGAITFTSCMKGL